VRRKITIERCDRAPAALDALVRELMEVSAAWARLEPMGRQGHRTRIGRVRLDGRAFVVKMYELPLAHAARTFLRRSRARREFQALSQLVALLPRPVRPAAWAEQRTAGLAFRSIVATEEMEGAVDLKTLREDIQKGRRSASERERLVRSLPALAAIVRRMHDAGFFAGSLYGKNVLWVATREGEDAFSVIDLPFARQRSRPLPTRDRAYDLACLDKGALGFLARAERLRFLLAYRGRKHTTREDRAFVAMIDHLRRRRSRQTPFTKLVSSARIRAEKTAVGKMLVSRKSKSF
jgi:hypothetical protein